MTDAQNFDTPKRQIGGSCCRNYPHPRQRVLIDLGNNLTLGETNEKFTFTQFTAVNR